MKEATFLILVFLFAHGCKSEPERTEFHKHDRAISEDPMAVDFDKKIKTIHILVALCDNKYQGIVPVPEKIGNGQDPYYNLYWGTAYGIKTYFKKSKDWNLIESFKIDDLVLERIIFKHVSKEVYLVADAYDG